MAAQSSIPDLVFAFDQQGQIVYANPALQVPLGLCPDELLGRHVSELGYPSDLADQLRASIDQVLNDEVTIEHDVLHIRPTGDGAYFGFAWGPVRAEDGSMAQVVSVSRDTTRRHVFEDALTRSEARLRAATELAGLGVYSWNPVTGALEWDARLRAMFGLPPDAPVDMDVYEAGIHPDDVSRVRDAIAACVDPAGDGRYDIEYRVIGRDDGVTRHIATAGRAIFEQGRAVDFIGAAIDVTAQRHAEAAIRESEAQFRSFAKHSCSLIWILDPKTGNVTYRNAAFDRLSDLSRESGPISLNQWLQVVHADDRHQVERALATVQAGEVTQYDYRMVGPTDGAIRWLRDTSFPILDEDGAVNRIGGIAEDLTPEDRPQVYVVSSKASEARRLMSIVRASGYRARIFDSACAFLDVAPVLSPGYVLVDLRGSRLQGLSVPRELKARSIRLPTIVVDGPAADVTSAVAAMKAGAIDYFIVTDDEELRPMLANALTECRGPTPATGRDETAAARVARLTPREREVLMHLVDGQTNKTIGERLSISPRTVELHRSQVMSRVNAANLTELLQIAFRAGLAPPSPASRSKD